jgi:hypothetical protein
VATKDSPLEVYKFTGMKDLGTHVDRIIVEGSTSNPERYVDLGGTIELTEEEASDLKASGHKLTKQSEESSKDDSGEGEPERGSTQTVASGAQAPASSPEKDKRPGSPGAGKN